MAHHEWGDNDFDWDEFGNAIRWYRIQLRRFVFTSIGTKEKYGTMRLEYQGKYKIFARFFFNMIALRAAKKWPQFKDELFHEYDFQESLYKWVKRRIGFKDTWRIWRP